MTFIKIGKIRLIEKYLLAFTGRNKMFIPILIEISLVPFKTGNIRKIKFVHMYIYTIYSTG
ncbi:MAG: hypothetical protein A2W19_01930 [Spirochaetes bacterium RBG_16_49_21]|nr:MAG: hypothetical protein A2W19_01930 [Spirochaetes bacterium RBG_16_49_21]